MRCSQCGDKINKCQLCGNEFEAEENLICAMLIDENHYCDIDCCTQSLQIVEATPVFDKVTP